MNRFSESFRLASRTMLYLIAIFSVLKIVLPPHDEMAAPIRFTVAIAGLAASCRPIAA